MDPNDSKTNQPDPGAGNDAAPEGAAAIDAALGTGDAAPHEDVIAGMDKAIAEAVDEDAPPPAPAAAETPPAKEGDDGKPPEGQPEPKPGELGPDGKPVAKPEDKAAPDQKPEPDAEAIAEAKALGLKDKASERFVEMIGTLKTQAPFVEALQKAGVKDPAEVPKMVERAKAADDMIAMVMSTGADEEQYGKTLDYMTLVNAGAKGNAEAAEAAWNLWLDEGKSLAAMFGKELPGVVDPLATHPDLLEEVEKGDIKRERALRIAAERAQAKLVTGATEAQRTTQAQAQAQQQGIQSLRDYDAQMLAADPTYLAKRPILHALVATIRETLPPSQWRAATERAYAAIPAAAAPVAPVTPPRKPPPGPMRPGAAPENLHQTVFEDPMDAINAGIEHAA